MAADRRETGETKIRRMPLLPLSQVTIQRAAFFINKRFQKISFESV
ncbi:hypothetical protein B4100_2079 [Heyndrickxia coagulans]|nr:hypothetical protein B4100_2079 [Heyndrickxia coagulans]